MKPTFLEHYGKTHFKKHEYSDKNQLNLLLTYKLYSTRVRLWKKNSSITNYIVIHLTALLISSFVIFFSFLKIYKS